MALPTLIIGQGLAGTALAWRLHELGAPFNVVDRDEPLTSSKVAAGLVTPVTGMRLNLNWRFAELYPEAVRFYRTLEKRLSAKFFHRAPVVRLLRDEAAAQLWEKRSRQPELRRFIQHRAPAPLVDPEVFAAPFGGFEQKHSGWLDTAAFLSASRKEFAEGGCWEVGEVRGADLSLDADTVRWRGRAFSAAVFCTGWEACREPWFDWVPFQSARGSILTLEADTRGERRVINRGCWLLPRADGTLRAGPTYELDFADPNEPAAEAIAGLTGKLGALLKVPFTVTACQTAARPIIKGHHALLGRHPAHARIAFFNGLGSKGVLRAPGLAALLASHLIGEGGALPVELDLAGNL